MMVGHRLTSLAYEDPRKAAVKRRVWTPLVQ